MNRHRDNTIAQLDINTAAVDVEAALIRGIEESLNVCTSDAQGILDARDRQRTAALVTALRDTLRCLKQHLHDDTNAHGLGHVSALCPCWDNEVKRAETVLAAAV